jgi:hypothetical protein
VRICQRNQLKNSCHLDVLDESWAHGVTFSSTKYRDGAHFATMPSQSRSQTARKRSTPRPTA